MDEETNEVKRVRRLKKFFTDEGIGVFQVTMEDDTVSELEINSEELSESVQLKALQHGLLSKIGDAAAGKSGQEAVDAIQRVIDTLIAGNWNTRKEGGGATGWKKAVADKLAAMSDEEREAAIATLAKAGLTL